MIIAYTVILDSNHCIKIVQGLGTFTTCTSNNNVVLSSVSYVNNGSVVCCNKKFYVDKYDIAFNQLLMASY
jgi:hypothetical protein